MSAIQVPGAAFLLGTWMLMQSARATRQTMVTSLLEQNHALYASQVNYDDCRHVTRRQSQWHAHAREGSSTNDA